MANYSLFDKADMKRLTDKFDRRNQKVKEELARALNKAGREVVNLSSAEWNAHQAVSRDYVSSRLVIVSGATADRQQVKVYARDRATRVNNFRYRLQPSRGGVHLNVAKSSAGAVIRNAFIVRARSDGKPLVLERIKKYARGEEKGFRDGRFKALYGPSVNQHFRDSRHRVAPQAMSAAKEQFMKALRL